MYQNAIIFPTNDQMNPIQETPQTSYVNYFVQPTTKETKMNQTRM